MLFKSLSNQQLGDFGSFVKENRLPCEREVIVAVFLQFERPVQRENIIEDVFLNAQIGHPKCERGSRSGQK